MCLLIVSNDTHDYFADQDEDRFKVGMSALTARSIAILRHIPFSVPFLQRVKVL